MDDVDLRVPRDLAKADSGGGSDDADVPSDDADVPGDDLAGADGSVIGPVVDSDIRDVQQGVVAVGSVARISGVVTGVDPKTNFFFVQEPDGAPEWSGIAVYLGSATTLTKPTLGDTVTLQGTVKEFKTAGAALSRTNIEDVTFLEIGAKATLPAPAVIAAPSGLNTESSAEPYEGVLIRVDNPSCTKAPDSFKEFQITGTVFVDDRLYDYTATAPVVGDKFAFVVGLFDYNNGHYKILPRSAEDMPRAAAPLNLVSVTPTTASIQEGSSTTLTITLSANATTATSVGVSSNATGVANPASSTVTVAAGSKTTTVVINGIAASATAATITVSLTGSTPPTRTAAVTVTAKPVDPPTTFLSPAAITVQANTGSVTAADRTGIIQVNLPAPAPVGGKLVLLESSNSTLLAVADEVLIPEGETHAGFRVRADSGAAGTVTITATDGDSLGETTVTIATTSPAPVAGATKELVINEVLYDPDNDASCNGQRNAEGDEFVELVNISNHAVDLQNVSLWDAQALASGSLPPIYKFTSSVILGPGEAVLVFGKPGASNVAEAGAPWCSMPLAATASTIGDARFFVSSQGLLLANGGDSVTVTLAAKTAVLDTMTYENNDAENLSLEREPQRGTASTFVRHTLATGSKLAWSTTPGTLATGLPFSLANP